MSPVKHTTLTQAMMWINLMSKAFWHIWATRMLMLQSLSNKPDPLSNSNNDVLHPYDKNPGALHIPEQELLSDLTDVPIFKTNPLRSTRQEPLRHLYRIKALDLQDSVKPC